MGLHADFSPLTCWLFLLLPSFLLNTERSSSGQCPGQDGEGPSMTRFPCLPLARPSTPVGPSSLRSPLPITSCQWQETRLDRGARLPVCLQDVALSATQSIHSITSASFTSSQPTLMSVPLSFTVSHSGDTRLSQAPFLPPKGESYVNTPFFFLMAFNILF